MSVLITTGPCFGLRENMSDCPPTPFAKFVRFVPIVSGIVACFGFWKGYWVIGGGASALFIVTMFYSLIKLGHPKLE